MKSLLPGATGTGWFSPAVAGFVTVLVGFTSSYALVVQAAAALGLGASALATMTAALALGMGLTSLLPSLVMRIPLVTAWSTPGAALLAVSLSGVSLPEAIGAFVACGLLMLVAGATGWFARVMHRIPLSLASALLAGVLLRFGLEAFAGLATAPAVVGVMVGTYLLARRVSSRYAVPLTLMAGALVLAVTVGWPAIGDADSAGSAGGGLAPLAPLAVPAFSVSALLGVALPLFVVTMASQNLPGVAVLQASGYRAPVSAMLIVTGVATLVLAPWGVFALNLAAITAALCMGPEAHPDPARRWRAAACAGGFYLVVAVFAAPLAQTFMALPREFIVALAGLALIPTIARGLHAAVLHDEERDPAVITFLVTASGLTLWGIGPAFWGVLLGVAALVLWRRPSAARPPPR